MFYKAHRCKTLYSQENVTKNLTGYDDCHFKIQVHDRGVLKSLSTQLLTHHRFFKGCIYSVLTTTKELHLLSFSLTRKIYFFKHQNKCFLSTNIPKKIHSPLSFWRSSFKSGPASMKILSDTGFLSVRLSLLVFTIAVQFSNATSPFLRKINK